jgi:hypothetical protein
MLRQPHYPNLRLSDYFSDDDFLSGVEAARLIVARDKRRPPAGTLDGAGVFEGGH